MEENKYILPENKVPALKIRYANRKSAHNDFQYPEVGETVKAPDWRPTNDCGYGLHGYLWGEGDITVSLYNPGEVNLFQVHEVGEFISMPGKIKYPSALVIEEFDSIIDALKFIDDYTPQEFRNTTDQVVEVMESQIGEFNVIQDSTRPAIQISGKNSIQRSAGEQTIQNAMHSSVQITKHVGYQNAGWSSVQIGKDNIKQVSSNLSIQKAEYRAVQTGGDNCIQESESKSVQKAGNYAIQRSGRESRLSAGSYSIQYAGVGSMCRAGLHSHMFIRYNHAGGGYANVTHGFSNVAHGFVDGKKIKADTWYKVNDNTGKFYQVDSEGKRVLSRLSILKNKLLTRLANLNK